MTRSLRTDPYPLRAARRAARTPVPIRVTPPRPGFTHPATAADIERILTFFGPAAVYGLRAIELRQLPPGAVTATAAPVSAAVHAAAAANASVNAAVDAAASGAVDGHRGDRRVLAVAVLARFQNPGVVLLYEQPDPPWLLPGGLTPASADRLERAGARLTAGPTATRVDWPGDTLRDLMLFDGLLHEIGHHVVQHAACRHTAAMRTADYKRRADAYAADARRAWTAAQC